jgi:hypothetical protein
LKWYQVEARNFKVTLLTGMSARVLIFRAKWRRKGYYVQIKAFMFEAHRASKEDIIVFELVREINKLYQNPNVKFVNCKKAGTAQSPLSAPRPLGTDLISNCCWPLNSNEFSYPHCFCQR